MIYSQLLNRIAAVRSSLGKHSASSVGDQGSEQQLPRAQLPAICAEAETPSPPSMELANYSSFLLSVLLQSLPLPCQGDGFTNVKGLKCPFLSFPLFHFILLAISFPFTTVKKYKSVLQRKSKQTERLFLYAILASLN